MDRFPDQSGVRQPGAPHGARSDERAREATRGLPLGQLLLERHLVTEEQLGVALAEHKRSGKPLGRVMVDLGFVEEATIAQALATQHGGMLKTEYGFATGLGEDDRPRPLSMLEPLTTTASAAATTAEESNGPVLRAGLPSPMPLSSVPAEPVATEEPPLRVAVVAGQNEGPADVASAESAADLVADEGGGEAPAAVVVQLPDVDGDADPMPVDDREAEAEGSLQLLTRVAEKLETRVAELEARIDAVRLAAETAAAEAATACADARVAVEHGTRLEGELAVARQPEQALRVELERLAAAAEQSLAQRELQERLVRTRLLELEQRLDSSNTARG